MGMPSMTFMDVPRPAGKNSTSSNTPFAMVGVKPKHVLLDLMDIGLRIAPHVQEYLP